MFLAKDDDLEAAKKRKQEREEESKKNFLELKSQMERQKPEAEEGIADEIGDASMNKAIAEDEDDDAITDFYGDSFKESMRSKAKAESGVLENGPAEYDDLDEY